MQIHEITIAANRKIPKLDEGIAASVKAGIKAATPPTFSALRDYYRKDKDLIGLDFKQKTQKFAQDQAVQDLSEKAWSKWQLFDNRQRSLYSKDPVKLAAYVDRSDQTYEKNLLAFVMQNLLPGKYMSQLSNGPDIQNLIKEISAPMAPPPGAPPPAPGAPPAGTNTPENQLAKFTELVATTAISMTAGDTADSTEKQLAAIGKLIKSRPGTVTTGKKTDNPVMDKALTDLGFTLI